MCVFDLTMNHTVLLWAILVNSVCMKMFLIFQGHCEFLAFGLPPPHPTKSSKLLAVLDVCVSMGWALDYYKGQGKSRGKGQAWHMLLNVILTAWTVSFFGQMYLATSTRSMCLTVSYIKEAATKSRASTWYPSRCSSILVSQSSSLVLVSVLFCFLFCFHSAGNWTRGLSTLVERATASYVCRHKILKTTVTLAISNCSSFLCSSSPPPQPLLYTRSHLQLRFRGRLLVLSLSHSLAFYFLLIIIRSPFLFFSAFTASLTPYSSARGMSSRALAWCSGHGLQSICAYSCLPALIFFRKCHQLVVCIILIPGPVTEFYHVQHSHKSWSHQLLIPVASSCHLSLCPTCLDLII